MAEKERKIMKGVTIGSTTRCLFKGLPAAQAGWLIKAWIAYVEDGTEPSKVPSANMGAWLSMKHEVDTMTALSKIRSNAGRRGMGNRYKKDFVITKPNTVITKSSRDRDREGEGDSSYPEALENNLPRSVLPARPAREAGATPAPPAPSQRQPIEVSGLEPGLADRLAEAMKAAPLSPAEAIEYARSVHCGLTPAQVLEWAEWNCEKGWARDSGGNLHQLSPDGARASMRRWRTRQAEIDSLRRVRNGNAGGRVGGDVTIRGVRIANRGGGLADKAGF